MPDKNIESLIEEHAPIIAEGFVKAAKDARTEEDVRQDCNYLINQFIRDSKLELKVRNEYNLLGGRIDSKYGAVIIEYKDPRGGGKITEDIDAPGTVKVIDQIKSRFDAFELKPDLFQEKIFGVGLDGDTIVYVEKKGKDWKISVQPVTEISVEKFLRALVSVGARGKAYTPENLSEDFGAGAENTAQEGVRALYNAISKTDDKKAKTFFKQWKILFGEVCGYDVEGKTAKIDELAESYLIPEEKPKPAELLFAVHTYYSIFMKLLAAEIASSFSAFGTSIIKECADTHTNELLKDKIGELESGGIWRKIGVTNFLEGNLFSWFVDVWDDNIAKAVRQIVKTLDGYDTDTLAVEPAESRDLLKKLYHELFPRKVRHDLGEYYTPDWLAEYTLEELGYDGDPDKRILDPACGSGTFLVIAINRIKKWYEDNANVCGFDKKALRKKILDNVIGFDLNPLAVMAARTNYLMAIRDFLKFGGGFEIPIYLCDSIMTPAEHGGLFKDTRHLRIAALTQPLEIPAEITESREIIGKYTEEIEQSLAVDNEPDIFVERLRHIGLPVRDEKLHENLYEKLLGLKRDGRNGVWARIIKNAFAPLFIGKVDYVAGNPPWVNWENLPGEYRDNMKPLWEKYGLFSLKGHAARLGGGKKDLSMIFTYSSVDNYLKMGGKLGFVITQSVFKTKGAGDGFRTFFYENKEDGKVYVAPLKVADMSGFQPFAGAMNRTAVLIVEKNKKEFDYPVPYVVWIKVKGGKILPEYSYDEVIANTERNEYAAIPVDDKKPTSPWLTAPADAMKGIKKVIGKSDYKAHAGCCTWLNGVYWVEVLEELPNGNLLIRNLHNVGKIKVKKVEAVVEPDFVYPLLRGRDVQKWTTKESCSILMVQDPDKRVGVPEYDMKINWPKTFDYFTKFEDILKNRPGIKKYFKETDAFYTIYDVTTETMTPIKVMWRQMIPKIRMVVVDERDFEKMPMTQHVVSFVGFEDSIEANYFCSMGNSSPTSLINECYSTGKSFGAPHILKYIGIPKFDPSDERHIRLSELSEACHAAAKTDDTETIEDCEKEIDQIAADIWGITKKELKAIQEALK